MAMKGKHAPPVAVYHVRVALLDGDRMAAPTVEALQACVAQAIRKEFPKYGVTAAATRTDM